MATKINKASSPIKGVTVAQLTKVAKAMGVENAIANTAQSWGIMAVTVAHSCAYLTASEAYAAMRPIATLLGNANADSIALKGVPRIAPYSANGGLAAQFASGKGNAAYFGTTLKGVHSYHPANFVNRNYVAALGSSFEGVSVVMACEAHGIPNFNETSSTSKGASYPDNRACNASCKIGLQVGDTLAVKAIAGNAKPKQPSLTRKGSKGGIPFSTKQRSEAATKAAATRKANKLAKANAIKAQQLVERFTATNEAANEVVSTGAPV